MDVDLFAERFVERFSERLKLLRTSRNLTQPALGAAIGVQKQYINDMEHRRSYPRLYTLIALADHFDVSLDYLVGRSDDPTRR